MEVVKALIFETLKKKNQNFVVYFKMVIITLRRGKQEKFEHFYGNFPGNCKAITSPNETADDLRKLKSIEILWQKSVIKLL